MKPLLSFLTVLAAIPAASFAQTGADINQAIPIYFGQIINDTIDGNTRCCQVYSIALSKGQQVAVTVTASSGNGYWGVCLEAPNVQTIQQSNCVAGSANWDYGGPFTLSYQVATAGTYYVAVVVGATGHTDTYTLQVTAQGTPITTANPPQAGCLTGQVANITYSLQLIAAGLPDTVTIGSTQACASCTVKPPAYPALVSKMETAMGLGVGVSACYDSSGNIFQLTLNHP
jgi:hypothetical protein